MSRENREVLADWLMLLGGLALFVSLFLAWSHQMAPGLTGVPAAPTAWEVYSTTDVLLAILALALALAAMFGSVRARLAVMVAAAIGLAFVAHALGSPPTSGANVPGARASEGPGITVAVAALSAATAGLLISFTAD